LPIKNRRKRDLPLAPGLALGCSKGAAGTFKPADVAAIVAEVGQPSAWPAELMASWLDNALTLYLGNFATATDGASSKKEEWAANLCIVAADCLAIIAPGFDPRSGRPPSVDRQAYSHLFSLFPVAFESGDSLLWHRGKVLDDPNDFPLLQQAKAIDEIAQGLARLWEIADRAAKGWASRKGKTTNKVASWRLSWVGMLGCIYALAFRHAPPKRPTEDAPFICFCEAVKAHALAAKRNPSNNATDAAAFHDLEKFKAGRLVEFIRRETRSGRLAWTAPDGSN
jgi:hypothetical protein